MSSNESEIAVSQQYKDRKRSQVGVVTTTTESLAESQGGLCFYCGEELVSSTTTLDHMTPLGRGGLHDNSNLVASCLDCNTTKNSKTAEEFAEWLNAKSQYIHPDGYLFVVGNTPIYKKDVTRFDTKWKIDKSGCWLWVGSTWHSGYGRFHVGRRKSIAAHRISYVVFHGSIPAGCIIDHLCGNRSCVNPSHLEAVTPKVNMERAEPHQRTHCPQGHEYTEENTRVDKRGIRSCKACARDRMKSAYHDKAHAEGRTVKLPNKERTHCPQGHEYTKENTRIKITKAGGEGRVCRICHRRSVHEGQKNKRRVRS